MSFEIVRLGNVERFNKEHERKAAGAHKGRIIAFNKTIAFTRPTKEMSQSRVALASTAGPHLVSQTPFDMTNHLGDMTYRVVPSNAASTDIRFTHDHYDHTDADNDPNCIFPVDRLRELASDGHIGSVASMHLTASGFMPDPRPFLDEAVPEMIARFKDDDVDVVLLTGGCPNCMRTVALLQNALEAAGFATASLSTQPQVAYRVGVPRAACVRFPNGIPFGEPGQADLQRSILKDLLRLVWWAEKPGTVVKLPYRWFQQAKMVPSQVPVVGHDNR